MRLTSLSHECLRRPNTVPPDFSARQNAFCSTKPLAKQYSPSTMETPQTTITSSCSCYRFCPVGEIVCSVCEYPIGEYKASVNLIGKHETRCNNHVIALSLEQRKEVVSQFEIYIDDIATLFVAALPDEGKARSVILERLDQPKQFHHCTSCNELVYDKKTHTPQQHRALCKTIGEGVTSKYWKKRSPKVLSTTFSLTNKDNFGCQLWKAIEKKNRPLPTTHVKVAALTRLLAEGENDIINARNNIPVQVVDINQNPDLWLKRSGWHVYLDGFSATDIHKMTLPFNPVDDVQLLRLEANFEAELTSKMEFVRRLSSLHQIFYEVERRPHKPYPSKPFTLPSTNTCQRYISIMKGLFRILLRVNNHQIDVNDDTDTSSSKYPTISFTENQQRIIDLIYGYPNDGSNYINLLLALAEQTYNNHPYECALICMLAYSSVNYDSTFKQPKYFTRTYAAILGVYKVLVINYCISQSTEYNTAMDLAMVAVPKYLSHPADTSRRPNVMSYVINVFSYAFAITRNTPVSGFIGWKGQEVRYQTIHLTMTNLRYTIVETCTDAEKLLLWLCEVSTMSQLPIIPWDHIYDNIDNDSLGYSFITETKNSFISSS